MHLLQINESVNGTRIQSLQKWGENFVNITRKTPKGAMMDDLYIISFSLFHTTTKTNNWYCVTSTVQLMF